MTTPNKDFSDKDKLESNITDISDILVCLPYICNRNVYLNLNEEIKNIGPDLCFDSFKRDTIISLNNNTEAVVTIRSTRILITNHPLNIKTDCNGRDADVNNEPLLTLLFEIGINDQVIQRSFSLEIALLNDWAVLSAQVGGFPLWLEWKTLMSVVIIFKSNSERQSFLSDLKAKYLSQWTKFNINGLSPDKLSLSSMVVSNTNAEGNDYRDRNMPNCTLALEDDETIDGLKVSHDRVEENIHYNWVSISNDGLCPTYPKKVYVPKRSVDPSLKLVKECASFRSEGRFPVLSYYHRESNVALCRASQPLIGFTGKSVADRIHLLNIADGKRLLIADLRPKLNALANRAQGKGYESERDYEFVDYKFYGLENIHVIRDAWYECFAHLKQPTKLNIFNRSQDRKEQSRSSQYNFLTLLSSGGAFKRHNQEFAPANMLVFSAISKWHSHVYRLLHVSNCLAKRMFSTTSVITATNSVLGAENGRNNFGNILVHCSDGWDRTSQVCSLVQLMIDPFSRTISGFLRLIQKQWLDFGFKFGSRCQQTNCFESRATGDGDKDIYSSNENSKEASPIWIQFLEALYQLMSCNLRSFEFTQDLLIDLHEISCRFDYIDFRGNSANERTQFAQRQPNLKCYSFNRLRKRLQLGNYTNKLYDKVQINDTNSLSLLFLPSLASFTIWSKMYSRYQTAWLCSYQNGRLSHIQFYPSVTSIIRDALFEHNYRFDAILQHCQAITTEITSTPSDNSCSNGNGSNNDNMSNNNRDMSNIVFVKDLISSFLCRGLAGDDVYVKNRNSLLKNSSFWLCCGLNHLIGNIQAMSFIICDICNCLICHECAQFFIVLDDQNLMKISYKEYMNSRENYQTSNKYCNIDDAGAGDDIRNKGCTNSSINVTSTGSRGRMIRNNTNLFIITCNNCF
ncbi:hypothetical protein GJ496_003593 [Pomphorhynchus laevis]|nr:hypothetical protein GJ496_003593 [Pomphorhynchus laevis]